VPIEKLAKCFVCCISIKMTDVWTENIQFYSTTFGNELQDTKNIMESRQLKYMWYAPKLKKEWTEDEPTTRSKKATNSPTEKDTKGTEDQLCW
jgi:hypothetical protein